MFYISLLLIIISVPLYREISESLSINRLNIYSYFFYFTLVLSVVGCLILGADITNYYLHRVIIDKPVAQIKGMFWISFTFFMIPIVVLLNQKYNVIKSSKKYSEKLSEAFIQVKEEDESRLFYILVALTIISFVSLLYVFLKVGLENVPIIQIFQGADSNTLLKLRSTIGRNFSGNVYIKNILMYALPPLITYISFIQMSRFKGKKWTYLFLFLLVFSSICLLYDLSKAPLIRFYFSFVFLYPFFRRNRAKNRFNILPYVISIVLIFALFYIITPATIEQMFSFRYGPINRIFKSQAFSVFAHFDVFPNGHEYLLGKSLPSFFTRLFFNSDSIRSARVVMETINPDAVSQGIAGVMNGLFIGEAYANFSYIGIFISVIIISTEMYLIHTFFIKSRKTPISLALYIYMMNYFVNTTQGGFVDFLYNPSLTIIAIIAIILNKIYINNGTIVEEDLSSNSIIVHLPFKINFSHPSGPNVRPLKIIDAYKKLGYDVILIEGSATQRKCQIENIKKEYNSGKRFKYIYSESSTMPTLLTEKHHLPTHPFVDFSFFGWANDKNIPIGLFYRDVYWKYDSYGVGLSSFKKFVGKAFYSLDLILYNHFIDVLFVPSFGYLKKLEKKLAVKSVELPPAISLEFYKELTKRGNKLEEPRLINVLYVGGVNEMYDISDLFESIFENPNIELTIVTREKDWKDNKHKYENYLNCSRINILHKSGSELIEEYSKADILSLAIKPNEYRDIAVPIKMYEYIAVQKPIIAYNGSYTGKFVSENKLGWTFDYQSKSMKEFFHTLNRDALHLKSMELKKISILESNLWESRVDTINNNLDITTKYGKAKKVCYLSDASNAHTRKWVAEAKRNGFDVTVISLNAGKIEDTKVYSLGEENMLKKSQIQKFAYLRHIVKINRLINEINPDVIHAHFASSYGLIAALINKPYLLSVWGKDVYEFPKKSIIHKLVIKYVLNKSKKIYSTSHVMKKVTEQYTKKEIIVTPFGVDLDIFKPMLNLRNSSETLRIGFIKLIEEKYGIMDLVHAVARLINEDKILINLVIVGKGSQKEEAKELTRVLGISDNCEFVSYVNGQNKVAEMFNSFDISVFPSIDDSESFGVAAVESMACGIATIVSDVDGFVEITNNGEFAVMYPRGNREELYQSIKKLIDNVEFRLSLGKKARKNVESNYNIIDNFSSVFDDYNSINK